MKNENFSPENSDLLNEIASILKTKGDLVYEVNGVELTISEFNLILTKWLDPLLWKVRASDWFDAPPDEESEVKIVAATIELTETLGHWLIWGSIEYTPRDAWGRVISREVVRSPLGVVKALQVGRRLLVKFYEPGGGKLPGQVETIVVVILDALQKSGIWSEWDRLKPRKQLSQLPTRSGEPDPATEVNLQRSKPGVKPDPEYDRAFQIVAEGNFTPEAYRKGFEWYCERIKLTKPGKKDRAAFKSAIKRRNAMH